MRYYIKNITLTCLLISCTTVLQAQMAVKADSTKNVTAEKVNVLFGTQDYNRFVGNMSVVKGENLTSTPALMVNEALKGKIPSFFNMQNNGNIGTANYFAYIRGSLSGYLVLIDDVERSLESYDIEQIDEIRVLKDPVSKALYGGRLSNGIVLIKTKRGNNGKPQFKLNVQKGIKTPTVLPDYLNSYDYATYYNQALMNDNKGVIPTGLGYSTDALDAFKNHTKSLQYPDVDYYGQFLNKSMNVNRVSAEYFGGDDRTKYYTHASYQDEGGFEAHGTHATSIKKMNIQGNVISKFSKDILLKANFSAYLGNKQYPSGFSMSTLSSRYPNAYPIFVRGDSLGGSSTYLDNPMGGMTKSGYLTEDRIRLQSDLGFEFKLDKLLKGLSLKPNLSFDLNHLQALAKKNTVGIYNITSFDALGNPLTYSTLQSEKLATSQALDTDGYDKRFGFTNTLNYERKFGEHQINADLFYYLGYQYDDLSIYSYKRQNTGLRVNYTLADKYTLEGVMNNTSSIFYTPDKKSKWFPAAGFGWLISKENFLKDSKVVDFLKFNASWGISGEGEITQNLWRETWTQSGSYKFNSTSTSNLAYLSRVNSDVLDWPKQREIDLSLEATLFKGLHLKASYFDYLNYDQLSQRSSLTPGIYGGTALLPYSNYGSTALKGTEFEISYSGKVQDFSYQLSAHLTHSKSEYITVDETDLKYSSVGLARDDIRGYQVIGKYTQADINQVIAGTMPQPTVVNPTDLKVGNLMYKDVNGDNKIDKYDHTVIGNSSPRTMYGGDIRLNYKGFELYTMLLGYGDFNRSIKNSFYANYSSSKYSSAVIDGLPNGNAHPLLTTTSGTNDFGQSSDYWIVDGGFLKVQNVTLSYSLPTKFVNSLKLTGLKLSLYGTDLMTFSKIKKSDPESIDAGIGSYPLFSTYAIGLSLSF